MGRFIKHIHDREFFYSYDLNRYHNVGLDKIIEYEHTVKTEYTYTGLPVNSTSADIEKALKNKNIYDKISKYYLSTYDLLIISMGRELKNIFGNEVYLLSNDERLVLISSKDIMFPKALYWKNICLSDLP